MKRKAKPKQTATRVRRDSRRAAPRARHTPALSDFLDVLIAANAQALGLTIDPAWHDSIKLNLGLILRLAALFDSFPLPDDTEPGPVFHA
jgi:Protein of unknown function (DUF4089)